MHIKALDSHQAPLPTIPVVIVLYAKSLTLTKSATLTAFSINSQNCDTTAVMYVNEKRASSFEY